MNIVLSILLILMFTGCCCNRPRVAGSCEEIHLSPSGKPFPVSWGKPPEIQTKDYVPLPSGFGYGSSTLLHWIERKQHDSSLKPLAPEPLIKNE